MEHFKFLTFYPHTRWRARKPNVEMLKQLVREALEGFGFVTLFWPYYSPSSNWFKLLERWCGSRWWWLWKWSTNWQGHCYKAIWLLNLDLHLFSLQDSDDDTPEDRVVPAEVTFQQLQELGLNNHHQFRHVCFIFTRMLKSHSTSMIPHARTTISIYFWKPV